MRYFDACLMLWGSVDFGQSRTRFFCLGCLNPWTSLILNVCLMSYTLPVFGPLSCGIDIALVREVVFCWPYEDQ